jgi:hypothetical protein
MRGNMDSFILEDGSRFYFDPQGLELIEHIFDCLHCQGEGVPFPEPPEVVKAIARARDREAALRQVAGGGDLLFPYEVEPLLQRGKIVPRSLVHGRELGEGPLPDLSEP